MFSFIPNELFITKTNVVYPPFKNGLYMEEYFLNYVSTKNIKVDKQGRRYIPALWTNFQIENGFQFVAKKCREPWINGYQKTLVKMGILRLYNMMMDLCYVFHRIQLYMVHVLVIFNFH